MKKRSIHTLPDSVPRWPRPGPDVRFLEPGDSLTHLEADLAAEIESAREWAPIAATWCDQRPVAFCYASSTTESLWDVSIDTAEAYRRRGLARSAVHLMDAFQRDHSRQPVWGSYVSNVPSLRLATRLGFVPVDTLFVFSRRPQP